MSNIIKNKHPDNYFSLLGLPVSFVIDKNKLTSNYHDIQKSIHPDNFANATALERRLSVQKAAQINDALQTLKNPLQRSIYLLSLYDIELGENNNSVDPAFLMEQMELRENLSQVSDKADPLAELDIILDDVKSRIKQINSDLETLFQQLLLNEQKDDELLKKASAQVLKMQFLNRLQEECLNKEDDLAEQL
ncbi:MAG: Fe-S protein assembly co-chaperone HscB [Gammaproteobacteria bacterium]|nr:MAG: Fe-S protein assembly co-chaperone HscB [Gammaproteobacteria bacterium]